MHHLSGRRYIWWRFVISQWAGTKFYKLLLLCKSNIAPGLKSEAYAQMIVDYKAGKDEKLLQLTDITPPEPVSRPRLLSILSGGSGRAQSKTSSVAAIQDIIAAGFSYPAELEPSLLGPAVDQSETLVAPGDAVSSGDGAIAPPPAPIQGIPKRKRIMTKRTVREIVDVFGVSAKIIPAYVHEGAMYQERWCILQCPEHGLTCTQSRGIHMDFERFGKEGVRWYLGTWLAHKSRPDHKTWKPNEADIIVFLHDQKNPVPPVNA